MVVGVQDETQDVRLCQHRCMGRVVLAQLAKSPHHGSLQGAGAREGRCYATHWGPAKGAAASATDLDVVL